MNCLDLGLAAFVVGFSFYLGKYWFGQWLSLWDDEYSKFGHRSIVDKIVAVIGLFFFMWLAHQSVLF